MHRKRRGEVFDATASGHTVHPSLSFDQTRKKKQKKRADRPAISPLLWTRPPVLRVSPRERPPLFRVCAACDLTRPHRHKGKGRGCTRVIEPPMSLHTQPTPNLDGKTTSTIEPATRPTYLPILSTSHANRLKSPCATPHACVRRTHP